MGESGNGEIPASTTSNNSAEDTGWYSKFQGMIADELPLVFFFYISLSWQFKLYYAENFNKTFETYNL